MEKNGMAKTIIQRFAARVLSLRTERRMTQEELAGRAGLHPRYISAIESARQVPSLTSVAQLARGLDVPLTLLVSNLGADDVKGGKVSEQIELISRQLRKCDLATVRKARKIVDVLAAK